MSDAPKKDREGARRWMAIGISTVFMFFSYTMFIFAFAAMSEDEVVFGGGLLGIACGLAPAVFLCVAWVSQRPRPIRGAALATLLFIVVGGPIAFFDIPAGLVAGFGAGGVVAIRRTEVHTTTSRVAAVVVCVVYVFVLERIIPAAGLMVGAVLPFVAVGIADVTKERLVETDEEAEGLISP